MPAPTVHSAVPEAAAGVLGANLPGGVEHVADSNAEAAAADLRCVAFVGPWLSSEVAEAAPLLSSARMSQLAPAAT